MQAKDADGPETAWARLASRAIRVALTRQDVSYAQLAAELNRMGVTESARSVEGKVQRGTFRFTFFLQALVAARVDCTEAWSQRLEAAGTWEVRACSLLSYLMSQQPWLDWRLLARRLSEIGIEIQPENLRIQGEEGIFSAALFFQCATVCRFEDVRSFLDFSSLNVAALAGRAGS
ncbi:DUF6471 domain-containing protein [Burkholderia cenocepacia]|uniref:DUF6471 domain-containing protein n=2 Tax=Caballeronia zhejiangensis TaxID=871203 RepID=A0A656QHZ3_9BURK|nr:MULTISPECIES: DUF6471 domain-containing protein [Burkholderiaceae]KAK43911.1 hypothetical protein BG58_28495 [Caballeronia jiangsuensis]KDR28793.1 hypothetical protein BG60_09240 [Caballeronia zhejiangensis]